LSGSVYDCVLHLNNHVQQYEEVRRKQRWKSCRTIATLIVAGSVYTAVAVTTVLHGRADDVGAATASHGESEFLLKGVRPTPPSTIASYIRDNDAAVILGKALFWDMQPAATAVRRARAVISTPAATIGRRTR